MAVDKKQKQEFEEIYKRAEKLEKLYKSMTPQEIKTARQEIEQLGINEVDIWIEKATTQYGDPNRNKEQGAMTQNEALDKLILDYQTETDPKKKQKLEEDLIRMRNDAKENMDKAKSKKAKAQAKEHYDKIQKGILGEAEEEIKEEEGSVFFNNKKNNLSNSTDTEAMTMATEQTEMEVPATETEKNSFVSDLKKSLSNSKSPVIQPQEEMKEEVKEEMKEEPKKNVKFETIQQEQPKAMPFQQATDAIGNRNNIGLAPLVDVKAKPENILVSPDVRKNSINRFANFKWVESIQNSRLGNKSSLYELQEIENERRFGAPLYYLTTPKPLTDREKKYISRSPKYTNKEEIGLIPRNIISTTDSERLPLTRYGWANYNEPDRHIDITQEEINKYPVSKKLGSPWNAEFRMSNMLMNRKEDTPKRNPLIYPSVMYDLNGRKLFN